MELIVRQLDESVDKIYQFHEIETLLTQQFTENTNKNKEIIFNTSSTNKFNEFGKIFQPKQSKLTWLNHDLIEIQDSCPLRICQEKCLQLFDHVTKNMKQSSKDRIMLVEDVSLRFNALNGLPGPYIKWFLEAVGCDGLHRMLADYDDKSAEAVCLYGLMAENRNEIIFCKGTVRGRIVSPRGSSWGWDPIFEEERSGQTFAEMDAPVKSKFSHRSNAITVLKKYLTTIKSF